MLRWYVQQRTQNVTTRLHGLECCPPSVCPPSVLPPDTDLELWQQVLHPEQQQPQPGSRGGMTQAGQCPQGVGHILCNVAIWDRDEGR